ncbi:MAG: hypothetical protein U9R72_15185, partial [Chloroflexota bacterium]|nr:hypothetical protein [Chloroflexota bacterium]
DVVIAVDVASDKEATHSLSELLRRRRYIPNGLVETMEVLYRSLAVMMAESNRRRLEETDPELIILPAIRPGVTALTGFTRAAEIIAAGEEAAHQALLNSSLA